MDRCYIIHNSIHCFSFVIWFTVVYSFGEGFSTTEDTPSMNPCLEENYKILSDLPKRSPDFVQDTAVICDRHLQEGWYRAPIYEMVTSPPSIGYCGTLFPFWLKGGLPVTAGTNKVLEVCQVGFTTDCQQQIDVNVTNCGPFNVYYLMPLLMCNSAYCFEKNEKCVDGKPKNPRVTYYNVEYTKRENNESIQYSPIVNLRCNFTLLDNDTLFYDIDWIVDNKTVIIGQTINSSSLDKAILSTQLLSDLKIKIGVSIQCIVGAKKTEKGRPCTTSSSNHFFAGIEVLTPTLSLQRKGSATVRIRPTIPVATETVFQKGAMQYSAASLDVTVYFPTQKGAKCAAGSSNPCKITIEGITYDQKKNFTDCSWYKVYEMEVQNTDTIAYTNNVRHFVLRMKTSGGGRNATSIFNEVILPDININVEEPAEDSVWKGKRCHSHADPHMKTFDGYAYECQHTGCVIGETRILFENREQNQQVQVRHHQCFNPNARCICAIAVRSGRDVFKIDVCNGRQYINFTICDDKSLKVVRVTDKSYKIFFPTGTYVDATLNMGSDWFIQTEIYPSVADVRKSGGLCGILDGNTTNDLTRRTGEVDDPKKFNAGAPPDAFSISWRPSSTEDLFAASMDFTSLNSLSLTKVKFCPCNDNERVTECSYQQFTDCNGITQGKEFQCINHRSASRRRRHAIYVQSFSADPIELNFSNRAKRQVYGITDNAKATCNAAFEASIAFRTCRDNVADFSVDSLKNCILDVSLTGDPSLVTFHLESAIDQCKAFINLNETLQKTEPEIAKEIRSICQNNCSNKGSCHNGSCFCDDGFCGSDCSFDMTEPPNITEVLVGELCDKSTEVCSSITFFGQYFVENTNATCYIQTNDVSLAGKIQSRKTFEEPLDVQTLYEANCPNPNINTASWIHQFVFNVSNDGQKFTRTLLVFVYDSECQSPRKNSSMRTFALSDGYCFIDGQCVFDGQTKKDNESLICDINQNVFQWSLIEECHDVLGRECFRYKDEDCVGVYETWARMNCKLRCGYCPQKLPCEDTVDYCDQFGPGVCRQETYGQYMREHCRKFCDFCRAPTEYLVSNTTSTTTIAPTTLTTTYNPVSEWCCDKTNCWYYPDTKCVGFYEGWARENCPFRCGYCPSYLPACVNLDQSCEAYPIEACTSLKYRAYMRENCRKRCNQCQYPGEHLEANTQPSPLTTDIFNPRCSTSKPTRLSGHSITTTDTSHSTVQTAYNTATTRKTEHIPTTSPSTKLHTEQNRKLTTSAVEQLNNTTPMTSPHTKVHTP